MTAPNCVNPRCLHPFSDHYKEPYGERVWCLASEFGEDCPCMDYEAPSALCAGCNHPENEHDDAIGCLLGDEKYYDTNGGFCPCDKFTDPAVSGNITPERTATMATTYPLKTTTRQYVSRSLGGYDDDVLGIRDLYQMGVHTLLLGEPGCGKTALIEAALPDAENDIGHSKMTLPDMMWRPRLSPTGVVYDPSPLTRAVMAGKPYYLDETMRLSEDGFTALFSAMDGRDVIISGNLDGSDLPIAPGFCVFGASNPGVRGAFLPEAIRSRFHILEVKVSETILGQLGLDDVLQTVWKNLSAVDNGEGWRPSIRELLNAQKFLTAGNEPQAAYALTGERVPAKDREQVAKVVGLLLGVRVPTEGGVIK